MKIQVRANAKINLTLDILGKRADGYHEVSMVMQSIDLADVLELEKAEEGIRLAVDVPWLAADRSNLAWRAAKLMQEEFSLPGGVSMRLAKRIPMAAGLAGGSADAAAVLRGMDALYALRLPEEKLCALGARLGSDIPFCVLGGTMLATGRGERLERLPDLPPCFAVLARPPIEVSTAWVYGHYDASAVAGHPDNARMQEALASKNLNAASKLLCNALESVTIEAYGIISRYKELMMEHGALASLMSGSGPTVFGLAESRERAEAIAEAMRRGTEAEVFVASTVGRN